jgi:hypothetical protein
METVRGILSNRSKELTGIKTDQNEINELVQSLKIFHSTNILSIMSEYPLSGCHFLTVEDNEDEDSDVGIDF